MNHPIDRPEEAPTAATTFGDGVRPGHTLQIDYTFRSIKTQEGIPKETHLHSGKMQVRSFRYFTA